MVLKYNLQFFAEGEGGEKTEQATPKKLNDARKKGQVAKSKEIYNGVGLLALFVLLRFWTAHIGTSFLNMFSFVYGKIDDTVVFWHGFMPENDSFMIFREVLINILIILAPVLAIMFVLAVVCDIAQVGWKVTGEPLKPKLEKLNPLNGVKRLFSLNSLVELIKSILKIFLIAYVCYTYLRDKWSMLFFLFDMPMLQALKELLSVVCTLGFRITIVYLIISVADLVYQKQKFKYDMKMTKNEVKEEFKQAEGDPQIKGKIRQRMREASQRRMMQDVPRADVVITNPTHYAVAISYDPDVSDAPIVLAKGEDYLAAKIKEVARENHVEIVENKPLARMLYANVEIGEAIPPELYQAVAEVLAFVYHLKGKA
ncbi:MAG: flagellar biosynthesis protein FlhB [Lachnospiraceae bacterium]|nr:flagellar biosynthesis protein FlhB [Lachnospiraceae bacterium]